MYTEPKIVTSNDLETRSYVTFYFNNKRIREYNGNSLNLTIQPNRAKSITERDALLRKLQFELHKSLDANSYPAKKENVETQAVAANVTTESLLKQALTNKLDSDLSKTYKRNLRLIHDQFLTFLSTEERLSPITSLTPVKIEQFLSRFKSSGTYYMDRRRDLGVLFSVIGRMIDKQLTCVQRTETKRIKAKLHKAYEKEQLRPIFDYLKANNFNLYLCCLLTYGAWLRPHEEARLLTKAHFQKECSEIHLSGSENKGGKVRIVYVPDYLKMELDAILESIHRNDNIFTRKSKPFNDAYFNTQWKRIWNKMYKKGLVYENQTIYSFRHTAVVQVFRRTKDVYLLQKLLGHSSIMVTLKYLRSLGEFNSEELKAAAPQLD